MRHLCANLTDVTLADEDTISILTDNANKAIQGNMAMQIIQVIQVKQFIHVIQVIEYIQRN